MNRGWWRDLQPYSHQLCWLHAYHRIVVSYQFPFNSRHVSWTFSEISSKRSFIVLTCSMAQDSNTTAVETTEGLLEQLPNRLAASWRSAIFVTSSRCSSRKDSNSSPRRSHTTATPHPLRNDRMAFRGDRILRGSWFLGFSAVSVPTLPPWNRARRKEDWIARMIVMLLLNMVLSGYPR
jgi:hypothetical protein